MLNKCLTDGCTNPQSRMYRGLCAGCYSKAKKLVLNGHETWDSLAAMGVVRLEEKEDPFTANYKKKKKK